MFSFNGYFKEYYINKKFIGMVNNVEKDRETMGFFGSKEEITKSDIILSNKKVIKANTAVVTQLHFINGSKK